MLHDFEPFAMPSDLVAAWRAEGWWTDETLGDRMDAALDASTAVTFRVWSNVRPYRGTLGDVATRARRLAGALHGWGLGPGDVVVFQLPNWMEAAVAFYGCALAGVVLAPVVHIYGPKELEFILSNTQARALITADSFGHVNYLDAVPTWQREMASLEHIVIVGERAPAGARTLTDVLDAAEPLRDRVAGDPESPAVIGFTSGTTADPKGVVQSHNTLLAELHHMVEFRPPVETRPNLGGSPISHVTGMLSLLRPLVERTPVELTDRWDPPQVLEWLLEGDMGTAGGATYFVTSMLDLPGFVEHHLDRMQYVGLGGAPIPVAVGERLRALGIHAVRAYGCTEHPSVSKGNWDDPPERSYFCEGRPLPRVELRIVDPEDGRVLGAGEPGEIQTRGPELFAGYTVPELTKAVLAPDGWFSTGDVGVVDDEGYLTITDRVKDIIIRGGENISAAEVEDIVSTVPGVAEVAVVAAPDERMGEHGCAFVRPLSPEAAPDLTTLRRHLEAAGLARQKWPEELRIVHDFDRTASGKIKKFVLRDLARRPESQA